MDAGSYPVSLVRMIAGERPRRVHGIARWADSGVDLTLIGSIEFASGLLAQVSCSFGTARHRYAFIAGDAGTIRTTYYNDTSAELPPILEVARGTGLDAVRETVETAAINGFLAEADAFRRPRGARVGALGSGRRSRRVRSDIMVTIEGSARQRPPGNRRRPRPLTPVLLDCNLNARSAGCARILSCKSSVSTSKVSWSRKSGSNSRGARGIPELAPHDARRARLRQADDGAPRILRAARAAASPTSRA